MGNRFHNHLFRKRTLNHLAPLEKRKIHLPILCKDRTSTKIDSLELSEKH